MRNERAVDILIISGAGLVLAGVFLLAGWPGLLISGGGLLVVLGLALALRGGGR